MAILRKKHNSNRAILVLESPWGLDERDTNRSSVLPFIEGVAKFAGDTEVFHANFYDQSSFKKALASLCKVKFSNTTIYIAAHGTKNKIGGVKTESLLFSIGDVSRKFNITGIMLGACSAGGATELIKVFTEGTNIRWCAGYSVPVFWLEGTLIDSAILSQMSGLDPEDFSEEDDLVARLAEAIAPFSNRFGIGSNDKDELIPLKNSMQFIVRPSGKGKRAKSVTGDVLNTWKEHQIRGE